MDQTVYIEHDGDEHAIGTVADLLDSNGTEAMKAARHTAMFVITDIIGEIVFGQSQDDQAKITISVR